MARSTRSTAADDTNPAAEDKAQDAEAAAAVEAPEKAANDTLEHTDGGVTTRSDETDLGVPMAPAPEDEPVPSTTGPEDALGIPATRGDYSERTVRGPSMVMVPIPEAERVPGGPNVKAVEQVPGA